MLQDDWQAWLKNKDKDVGGYGLRKNKAAVAMVNDYVNKLHENLLYFFTVAHSELVDRLVDAILAL